MFMPMDVTTSAYGFLLLVLFVRISSINPAIILNVLFTVSISSDVGLISSRPRKVLVPELLLLALPCAPHVERPPIFNISSSLFCRVKIHITASRKGSMRRG